MSLLLSIIGIDEGKWRPTAQWTRAAMREIVLACEVVVGERKKKKKIRKRGGKV